MWFKIRTGMVNIEGTVEFVADRWPHRSGGAKSIGVYAYQTHHADFVLKRWFRPPLQIYGRKIYLVCCPDDTSAGNVVLECMQRLEAAIRSQQSICDLSDLGTDAAWTAPEYGVMVRWPNQTNKG
jgi:hypothetical protein